VDLFTAPVAIAFAFRVLHGGQAVPLTRTLLIQRGRQADE